MKINPSRLTGQSVFFISYRFSRYLSMVKSHAAADDDCCKALLGVKFGLNMRKTV